MELTPWFQIGKDGPPVRSGTYEFELWLGPEDHITLFTGKFDFVVGTNFVILPEARLITLGYEDHWRGVLE